MATIEEGAFYGCNNLTIYGNEGQASYTYAQDNDINFKLISEWDNANIGDDITAPTMETLEIEWSSSFTYDSTTGYYFVAPGKTISIKATFDEEIYGDTAPTLTIKCGNGEQIEITNGVITGKYIVYNYTIKEQDKGIIVAVSMAGGDVADEAGNAVTEYTCPVLGDSIWGSLVYANGSGIVTEPDDEENPGETPDDSNDDDKGTSSGTGNNSGTGTGTGTDTGNNSGNGTNTEKDNTTAKGELPKTGKMTLISILIVTIVAGAISFIKTKKYKGI